MKRVLIVLLAVCTVCGCAKNISLDPGLKPEVAVECILSNESEQTLRLSFMDADADKVEPVRQVEATLTDISDGYCGKFMKNSDGTWILDYTAVPGHKYRLDIEIDGYDPIYSEQTMPADMSVKAHLYTYSSNYYPNTGNKGEWISAGSFYSIISKNRMFWIYGMCRNERTGEYDVVDEICTDYPNTDNSNLTGGVYETDRIYPHLAGQSLHKKLLMLKNNPSDSTYDFFVSGSFDSPEFIVPIAPWKLDGVDSGAYLVFLSPSEDFANFVNAQFQEDDELSSIYLRESSYTNIVGGSGLFGACTVGTKPWYKIRDVIYDANTDEK